MSDIYDQQFKPQDLVRVRPSSRVGDSAHQHWGRAIYLGRRGNKAVIKPLGGHKKMEEVPFTDIQLWRSKSGESATTVKKVIHSRTTGQYYAGKGEGFTSDPSEAFVYVTDISIRCSIGKIASVHKKQGELEIIDAPEGAKITDNFTYIEEKEDMSAQKADPVSVVRGLAMDHVVAETVEQTVPRSDPFKGINNENKPLVPLKIEPSTIKQADFLTITAEIEQLQKRMKDDYQLMIESKKSLQAGIARIRELNAIQAKLLESDDIFK